MKGILIKVDESVHKDLKTLAAEEGVYIRQIVEDLIKNYLIEKRR